MQSIMGDVDLDMRLGRRLLQSSPTVVYVDVTTPTTNTTAPVSTGTDIPETDIAFSRSCDQIDHEYDIAVAVVCSLFFIFGIIYTFFGEYIDSSIYIK